MEKIVVIMVLCLLSPCFVTEVPAQQFTLTIWIDRGCGGNYSVGEILQVHWEVSHPCQITFWEKEPDGTRRKLTTQPVKSGAGHGSMVWTIEGYGYEKRAIYAEAVSTFASDSDECEFYVPFVLDAPPVRSSEFLYVILLVGIIAMIVVAKMAIRKGGPAGKIREKPEEFSKE